MASSAEDESRQVKDAALATNPPLDGTMNGPVAHSHATNTMMGKFGMFIAHYPFPVMVLALAAGLMMAAMGMSQFSINTEPPQGRSAYAMDTDIITQRMDALWFAHKSVKLSAEDEKQQTNPVFQNPAVVSAVYVVHNEDESEENVFTASNLHSIRAIEKKVLDMPEWPDYCLKDADGHCKPPLSIINYMFPVNDTMDVQVPCPAVLPIDNCSVLAASAGGIMPKQTMTIPKPPFDGEVYNGTGPLTWSIENQLSKLIYPEEALDMSKEEKIQEGFLLQLMAQYHLTKNPDVSFSNMRSNSTRSLFQLGLPLEGYANADDRRAEQEEKAGAFTLRIAKVLEAERLKLKADESELELLYFGGAAMFSNMVAETLAHDSLYAVGSILFVLCYIWVHTQSLFIAMFGMLHIVLSFPVAYFFLTQVCGIRYFDTMNMFLLYIIMGIGADDIFVLMDAFQQSKKLFPNDLSTAMAYSLHRASKAMLVTSLTTALAFAANALSPLMPSAQFGIFAALMVATNYLFVISYFPAVVVIYTRYIDAEEGLATGCCGVGFLGCITCLGKKKSRKEEGGGSTKNTDETPAGRYAFDLASYGRIERFFYTTWGPFLVKYRKVVFAAFSTAVIAFIAIGTQFKTATDAPPPLPPDHMVRRIADDSDNFKDSDEDPSMRLLAVYGIDPHVDRGDHSIFDAMTPVCGKGPCGTMKWDQSFDAANPNTQQHLLKLCEDGGKIDKVKDKQVELCIYKDLKKWRAEHKNTTTWPVENADEFASHMQEFLDDPAGTPAHANRRNYVDNKLISWDEDTKKIGYLTIRWRVEFVQRKFYSYPEVKPTYDDWQGDVSLGDAKDGLMTVMNKKATDAGLTTCNKGYITTDSADGLFILMQMVKAFNDSAYTGIAAALSFASLVLIVSTGNVFVTIISALCIVCIVVSVLGMMVLYGWTLGVIEAVCLTLVSGFSVDFIVHYGLSYIECHEDGTFDLGKGRQNRVRFAFFEMGVSVIGGSMTTIGASIFLFFCDLTIFSQFGRFMCTTIILSILYANTLYMASLSIAGPEGKQGQLCAASEGVDYANTAVADEHQIDLQPPHGH